MGDGAQARTGALAAAPTRIGPEEVRAAARRAFLTGHRLDMQALARELSIARATLYRWVGGREELLGEVLWELAARELDRAYVSAGGPEGADLAAVAEQLMREAVALEPLRRFMENEPQCALRVLTTRDGIVQPRLVDAVARLLEAERADAVTARPLPTQQLAGAIVRIAGGVVLTGLIAGGDPDIDTTVGVLQALLA